MQPKKRKEKKQSWRTPEEVAKEFWLDFHRNLQERISQSIIDDKDISPDEKKHHLSYFNKKKSLSDNEPVGCLKDLAIEHHFLVKPNLPWDKIKSTLKAFRIDDGKIQTLIFILKPSPIEQKFLVDEVEELLGHKTLTMTLRYSHLAPSHKVKAVDLLNETLTGSPTVQKLYNPIKKEVAING